MSFILLCGCSWMKSVCWVIFLKGNVLLLFSFFFFFNNWNFKAEGFEIKVDVSLWKTTTVPVWTALDTWLHEKVLRCTPFLWTDQSSEKSNFLKVRILILTFKSIKSVQISSCFPWRMTATFCWDLHVKFQSPSTWLSAPGSRWRSEPDVQGQSSSQCEQLWAKPEQLTTVTRSRGEATAFIAKATLGGLNIWVCSNAPAEHLSGVHHGGCKTAVGLKDSSGC